MIDVSDASDSQLESIFGHCLSAASKQHTADHKLAIREGRASLYFSPARGFALVGVDTDGSLLVLAAAGRRVCVADQIGLLKSLALAEGCKAIKAEVTNPKLARKLSGLGFNVKRFDGVTFTLRMEI